MMLETLHVSCDCSYSNANDTFDSRVVPNFTAFTSPTPTACLSSPLHNNRRPNTSSSSASVSAASPSSAPPVDEDIGHDHYNYSVVQDETNHKWYDVVLNQCNITNNSNNNKYYIIQLLQKGDSNNRHNHNATNDTNQFYVWTKWGRVGGCTGSAMKGPFTTVQGARTVFAKKYRDKTANSWNDDDGAFQPKQKKYTKIDVDNRVRQSIMKTHSWNQRNIFNVTLREMPVGILTDKQIQSGIKILDQIKNKLQACANCSSSNSSDSDNASSYAKLSSQFYTAIPHPFSLWTRPPVISNFGLLSDSYDKCQRIRNELEQLKCMQTAMNNN